MIYKTSAKAYESAKQSTSNFESSVSASYGLASGQVSGSISNTDSDKIFNLLDSDKKIVVERPPIGVPLQSGVVDCPTYYDKLEQQTSLAPVSFQLVPIENLIDPDRNAFLWKESIEAGDVTREGLDQLAKRFADYVTRCRIGGCAQVSNACNKGFYGSNPMECRSCYAGAGPIGSLGNCHPSQECETISGQCMGQIPQPPKNRDTIAGNEIFTKGETLTSNPAGNCQLRFQSTDGNLVMHRMVRCESGSSPAVHDLNSSLPCSVNSNLLLTRWATLSCSKPMVSIFLVREGGLPVSILVERAEPC